MRTDSAGLTHDLLDHLHAADIRSSVGMDMTEDVRQALLAIGDQDWVPAVAAGRSGTSGAPPRAFTRPFTLSNPPLNQWRSPLGGLMNDQG